MRVSGMLNQEEGITLIELLVVGSIISILAIALAFSYGGWLGNYKIENESKQLYADLMDARTRAMTRNRMHFVVINAGDYSVYEDTNDNGAAEPGAGDNPIPEFRDPITGNVRPKILEYGLGTWLGRVMFNTSGIASFNPPTFTASISITYANPSLNPDYNCVVMDQTRIRMGQMSGASCVAR